MFNYQILDAGRILNSQFTTTWFPFQKNFLFLNADFGMVVASSQSAQSVQFFPKFTCIVGEYKIIAALNEHGRVVVRVQEHHDVVLLALSEEEMVGSLIAQVR